MLSVLLLTYRAEIDFYFGHREREGFWVGVDSPPSERRGGGDMYEMNEFLIILLKNTSVFQMALQGF